MPDELTQDRSGAWIGHVNVKPGNITAGNRWLQDPWTPTWGNLVPGIVMVDLGLSRDSTEGGKP